ncbi:hypothetical protein OVA11_19640 [Caulobacter sp. SL161]|uniref:hypothetical protein n=1 Tax=Caulobacter sp. SL161 TaxID=2995156 RepID=UPI002272BBD5|nr:hypothetical protein [Caulobacter sp. SL161]MCY1649188.1 hypothetical protein [Caulobacter sp. SL161]
MTMNETPPDTIVFIGDHHPSLWDLPWIDRAEVAPAGEGRDDERLVKLWFRRGENNELVSSALPPLPDRPHDLVAYNYGEGAPQVFWHTLRVFEAYRIDFDGDDGAHWRARIWLKQG